MVSHSPQPFGIDVDLILPRVAADGRNIGHAGNRPEMIAEIPVFVGAQFRKAVLAGVIDQRVLEDPSKAVGIGTDSVLTPSGSLPRTLASIRDVRERAQ